jgi:hypothetical protein
MGRVIKTIKGLTIEFTALSITANKNASYILLITKPGMVLQTSITTSNVIQNRNNNNIMKRPP